MLSVSDSGGMGRRSFLRVGSLGLGGMSLAQRLQAEEVVKGLGGAATGKSVVFLFMHGGPPQTETFDPKMDAPSGVRSVVGEVKTPIPGVSFGAALPKLARLAKQMAVVRSFTTGNGNHDIKPVVGADTLGANLGSLYSRVAGVNDAATGMPSNVALYPKAAFADAKEVPTQFGKFGSTGVLGPAYAPFVAGGGGDAQRDLELAISKVRLGDRRHLLGRLEELRRVVEKGGEMGRLREQAFDVILGGAAEAFDLTKEDPRTLARYDTGGLYDLTKIDKRWNNHENYRDHARSLGHLMLMARRLCERGCGFVTVTTNFVWDFHADQNNATVVEGLGYVGAPFDHAVAAFLQDLEERGLSEDILLVCCGEMGRTPRVNAKGGRDHWGRLAPLMLAGGGLRMGQVIGQSTADAGEPAADPVDNSNLIATVMNVLLDVPRLRTEVGLPADVARVVTGGKRIEALF
ncbi:MAG: DUF1501 domain-containing protein [Verrucomicrobiales bacterium]|nr:DUF1501 domain-containing protein [Verrucomicrobiales bacterium]